MKIFCSHIKKVCFHINKICSHIQKRICLQIQTANSHGKFSRQIPTANSQTCKIEDCVEYALCGRVLHVKIKRNKSQKKSLFKLKKPLRQRWLKLEVSKANISNISEI